MEQQDFFMRQIEQIGILLGHLISYLLSIKSSQINTLGISTIRQAFTEDLNIDFQSFISLDSKEAVALLESKGFDYAQMNRLVEMLMIIVERADPADPSQSDPAGTSLPNPSSPSQSDTAGTSKSDLRDFCKQLNSQIETQSGVINYTFASKQQE